MVDYKYKDLYNKSHIDKQIKIIACDFVGYGAPESKYPAKLEYEGKTYLDAETNYHYKCGKIGDAYKWEKILNEYELIVFKNSDIDSENFELSESLCSESELRFGCCEASVLKFRIHNTFVPLKDKWVTVTEVLDRHTDFPFQFGRYKVFSDVPTADRLYRDVTAYDSMYDIINSSAITWYNTILPEKDSKVTMRQFRTSFVNYFGLEQEETALANDDMIVEKTIQVEEGVEIENETEQVSILKESALSGKDVITAICEVNGCFGHIGRDGKFCYIYLKQDIMGLYPSNTLFPDHAPEYLPQSETGHLYPQSPKTIRIGNGTYISADYEDYICRKINKVQVREKENDIGGQYPKEKKENQNAYIIEDNFLVYGKSADKLDVICKNIFEKIKDIVYRPFSTECQGNPCLESGDPVRLSTRYELIESYILKRNLKGIQSLRDSYSSEGTERRSEKVNSVSKSIIQLKGKTNILERNVEETRSEIKDVESGLSSRIEQTVKSVSMSVSNDRTGKTAEVKLLVTDEGGTQYEVKADKIDLTGLVSFTNLETGGQTIINGNNIITGEINCSLLNGGEINGQKIVGGEITGAVITAKEGLYLQYTDRSTRPNTIKRFLFAKAGDENPSGGGISGDGFVNIYSPRGTPCILIGLGQYSEQNDGFYLKDTPFFPNGAMIEHAFIKSLQQTYKEFETITNGSEWINFKVRTSGVFVSVYGSYHAFSHPSGESKSIVIGTSEDLFIPNFHSVRTVGYYGKRTFVFVLDQEGKFVARNASDSGVNISATESNPNPSATSIEFRFDFFRF